MKFSCFFILFLIFSAVFAFTQSGLQIILEENNSGFTITGSKGSAKVLSIPGTIDGREITMIGENAFTGRGLTEVSIPDSVTFIGAGAFSFNKLETVTIGDNVTVIGNGAFTGNKLLKLILGSSVTSIGKGAFSNNMLPDVEIPETVTIIDDYAFFNNRLNSIEIPANVIMIGEGAFSGNRLTAVDIGNSVVTVKDGAFYNNRITDVNIPASVEKLGKRVFDQRSPDGRIRGNIVYTDAYGNILFTTANNFDAYYESTGKTPGRYILSEGSWQLQ